MPDEKPLAEHTVAELDQLGTDVEGFPSGANKAEKVAFLEAAGVAGQPRKRWRLSLNADFFEEGVTPSASFVVSEYPRPNRTVELAEGEDFETADYSVYVGLRDLPFLSDEGEVS
jgi:hypothetical protein